MASFGTTETCQIMPRHLKVRSHFSRCHFRRSLGAHSHCAQHQASRSLQEICATIQAAIQKPQRHNCNQPKAHRKTTTTIHGLCFFLWPSLGVLYPILQWSSGSGATFSQHHISPFQIVHFPNFPLPGTGRLRQRGWVGTTGPRSEEAAAIFCVRPHHKEPLPPGPAPHAMPVRRCTEWRAALIPEGDDHRRSMAMPVRRLLRATRWSRSQRSAQSPPQRCRWHVLWHADQTCHQRMAGKLVLSSDRPRIKGCSVIPAPCTTKTQ